MPSIQGKYWCFTLNNYTDSDVERIDGIALQPGGPAYVVYGREVGESGTPHLQGYVEYTTKRALARVKEHVGDRAHLERRRGSQSQAIEYCKKDGVFKEFGTPVPCNQGQRNDLVAIVGRLREGESLRDVALSDPETYCRYRNGLRDIATWVAQSKEKQPPKNIFIWGLPGTGKSKWAHELDPDSTWIYGGSGWFDGYTDQRVAIFDDFNDDAARSGGIPLGTFLKLLDRYPLSVPIKGGFTNWTPEIIVFTANRGLDEFYCSHPGHDSGAIRRRFPIVKRVNQLGELDGWNPLIERERD